VAPPPVSLLQLFFSFGLSRIKASLATVMLSPLRGFFPFWRGLFRTCGELAPSLFVSFSLLARRSEPIFFSARSVMQVLLHMPFCPRSLSPPPTFPLILVFRFCGSGVKTYSLSVEILHLSFSSWSYSAPRFTPLPFSLYAF